MKRLVLGDITTSRVVEMAGPFFFLHIHAPDREIEKSGKCYPGEVGNE